MIHLLHFLSLSGVCPAFQPVSPVCFTVTLCHVFSLPARRLPIRSGDCA
uniref:Uncharacterized protein n=1 Tax=Faecalibaculum rodentium TaxID=1702221 RepID=A0A140DW13_9FIRM|nr:hypothetical protein AALO17_17060 [Faecalibaculum rodentium]